MIFSVELGSLMIWSSSFPKSKDSYKKENGYEIFRFFT